MVLPGNYEVWKGVVHDVRPAFLLPLGSLCLAPTSSPRVPAEGAVRAQDVPDPHRTMPRCNSLPPTGMTVPLLHLGPTYQATTQVPLHAGNLRRMLWAGPTYSVDLAATGRYAQSPEVDRPPTDGALARNGCTHSQSCRA